MMLNLFPLLIPIAPLLAALFTVFSIRNNRFSIYTISWWLMVVSFLASLMSLIQAIQYPESNHIELFSLNWSILPKVNMLVDRLSSVMMLFISGFGVILYRYSIRYLQQDPGYDRYLTLLALCISSLLFMVSCADLIMLFIFWQLLTWFLALLSHNYSHGPTIKSGFRTFIVLRAGDLIFLHLVTRFSICTHSHSCSFTCWINKCRGVFACAIGTPIFIKFDNFTHCFICRTSDCDFSNIDDASAK